MCEYPNNGILFLQYSLLCDICDSFEYYKEKCMVEIKKSFVLHYDSNDNFHSKYYASMIEQLYFYW